MAYVHQFGIIDCISEYKENEYEPQKYNCVSVDGDFIDEISPKSFGDKMKNLNTFVNNIHTPYKDLAYCGITLIPPSSLKDFLDILLAENTLYKSNELTKVINKISNAIKVNKWVIHYGV